MKDGIVTLMGTVTNDGERENAVFPGVLGILDEIRMAPGLGDDDTDINSEIATVLERIPSLDGAAYRHERALNGPLPRHRDQPDLHS